MEKDWTGNKASTFTAIGARNYAQNEREEHDYYATDPKAAKLLLDAVPLADCIWECACGEGHLAEEFVKAGKTVIATDLIDRGYGGVLDFLACDNHFGGDIVTNPPYKYAQEFVEHALDLVDEGNKVCMFLKIQFLEGKARRKLFDEQPPKYVYVSTSRIKAAMNGKFDEYCKGSSAACYAWYVWEKGYRGETILRWMN